jgi:hypothetical protein
VHLLLPGSDEVLVEDREGDVGEQGRKYPALGSTSTRLSKLAILTEDAGLQERVHQSQDTLVPDTMAHPV